MTSPSPADTATTLAQRVSLQFADRPTFEQVAQDMLELTIKEKYPSLTIDLSKTQLATPNAAASGYTFQPFIPRVIEYLALGTPVDFTSRRELRCYLSDTPPRHLWPADGRLDMKDIETLVLELPWTVPFGLEDALIRYWNAEVDTHDSTGFRLSDELTKLAQTKGNKELLLDLPSTIPSEVTNTLTRYWNTESGASPQISRWRWLSDVFKNELHIRGLQQPGLTEPAREALDQIVRWPDRSQRFSRCIPPVYAYSLESTVTQGAASTVLPSNELLLLHFTRYGLVVLLCSPGSAVQSFESMEAFLGHWRERIASRYVVDSITIRRSEISGNAFDTLAAMMLEQQLADLRAVRLPSRIGLQDLSTLYKELSDPARYLLDVPRPTPEMSAQLEPLLPEWIKKASIVDQTKFQQYSLVLASAKNRSQGRTFLSDITDIKTFTADALLEHMRQENDRSPAKVPSSHYQLDDIELTFSEAVGAFGTAGYIEKREMGLIDLAIKNLVTKPKGRLTISHRQGLTLPAWLTPDFITRKNGLIEQVDIGTTYPKYLQQRLFDDLPQAQERERLFAEQIPAQLLLDALKLMLNSENGMTRQGLDLVEALLNPDADSQQVSGRPVVIRHLAFLRKPEAQPDIVTNMFIIAPQDVETGPHLLYAPLYAGSLLEFPTRQALLQAIVTPGTLQNSVLTWMSDAARLVYANGGFLEPHIVRFLQGDEFDLPAKPAPATLAIDGVNNELLQYLHNGKLMQYLYGSNARALVDQADRNSVSNSESRWAVFQEGASLLFNALLSFPVLPRVVTSIAWLEDLMASASQDIPALSSDDPLTRELAAVDVLLNLGILALHLPSLRAPAQTPRAIPERWPVRPSPRVVPERWPARPSPRIVDGPVALPGEYPETSSRILDLSQAGAHPDRRPDIRTLLQSVRVPRPASLPEPIKNGPLRGLYVIDRKWCALLGEHLYRVSPESDGSVAIVDPLNPAQRVLALGSDAQGNWFVDLRLRLRGGMSGRGMGSWWRNTPDGRLQMLYPNKDVRAQVLTELQGRIATTGKTLDRLISEKEIEWRKLDNDLADWEQNPNKHHALEDENQQVRVRARQALGQALRKSWRRQMISDRGGRPVPSLRVTPARVVELPTITADFSHVEVLVLEGMALSGDPSNFLRCFPNLRDLWLGGNRLTHCLPLGELPQLRKLSLAENPLISFEPEQRPAIGHLSQLEFLDLTGCQLPLDEDSGAFLAGLSELRELHLSGNNITELPSLTELTKLTRLNLSRARIEVVPQAVIDLIQREPIGTLELDLSGNSIKNVQPLLPALIRAGRNREALKVNLDDNPLPVDQIKNVRDAGFDFAYTRDKWLDDPTRQRTFEKLRENPRDAQFLDRNSDMIEEALRHDVDEAGVANLKTRIARILDRFFHLDGSLEDLRPQIPDLDERFVVFRTRFYGRLEDTSPPTMRELETHLDFFYSWCRTLASSQQPAFAEFINEHFQNWIKILIRDEGGTGSQHMRDATQERFIQHLVRAQDEFAAAHEPKFGELYWHPYLDEMSARWVEFQEQWVTLSDALTETFSGPVDTSTWPRVLLDNLANPSPELPRAWIPGQQVQPPLEAVDDVIWGGIVNLNDDQVRRTAQIFRSVKASETQREAAQATEELVEPWWPLRSLN